MVLNPFYEFATAQEGERSRCRAKLVRPQVVGQLVDVDEFSGSGLHGDWSWAQGRVGDAAVSGGLLTWEVERSDLYVDNNTASVLVRDAPRGDYVVERYTAYTSQDGQTWVRGGAWTHSLGANARIGLVSMGATDQVTSPITAEFDDVQVFSLKGGPRR